MGLADLVHALLVLLSCAAYSLPLYEAVQRRSAFWTAVFSLTITFSFALHCEESGLCRAYEQVFHERLRLLSQGMSLYLLGLMVLVAFEIRNEFVARAIMAVWATTATLRDASNLLLNIGGTLALGIALLGADALLFRRTFSLAWWRRLGLIAAMAVGGAAIFRLVHSFWWHGVWHVYLAGCVHLLLLAQRTKRMLAAGGRGKSGARLSGAPSAGVSSGVAPDPHTPLKRRTGDAPGSSAMGGAAIPMPSGAMLV